MTLANERPARVYTIPPGAGFLETLSDALVDGRLVPGFAPAGDPLSLAAATILVPTRRAARALAATLAGRATGPALLLPRILPLGALEALEIEVLFDQEAAGERPGEALPDAVAPLPRRLILTRLILEWAAAVRRAVVAVEPDGTRTLHPAEDLMVATSAADAWGLAGDLAGLADELTAEGVDWRRLAPLGTDSYDRYWRITLDFLAIVLEHWPTILAERGLVDGAHRQIALLKAETDRLRRGGADGPVIVAGSTGSNPATARLIAAVARLPHGAVVLPGLDQDLDPVGWEAVAAPDGDAASHPQAALKRLLGAIGTDRAAVQALGRPSPALQVRTRLLAEALRPAATTDLWKAAAAQLDMPQGLAGLALVEAPDERLEALAIAVALRQALEGPGTAVLVTPDRALGRRVKEELTRWSVDIDLSSGEPLGTTPAGALARLVLDSTVQDLAPVEVLALLAHPLARFGRSRGAVAALARTLEIAILRGVLPPRALHDPAGLVAGAQARRAGAHAPDPLRRLTPDDFAALSGFLGEVVTALAPLTGLGRKAPLPAWTLAHAQVLDAVTATPEADTALGGIDGNALAALFDRLEEAPEPGIVLDPAGYAALFERFAAETPVRGPDRSHPRLKILGLLEARLLSADLVILGGLDEGVWPPQSRTDAFLNRPMRASLGLPPPERRIGQTAHDFTMLLGAPRVVLTRAAKREGSPTVPSRFLLRLAALAADRWTAVRARGQPLLNWATALDRPAGYRPVARPAPKPPLALRPTSLSVTRIETLRRDPYAIHAEKILKLVPTEPIGAPMGANHLGTLFHDAVADIARRSKDGTLPPDAGDPLREALRALLGPALDDPLLHAFGWPRLQGWARSVLGWHARRPAAATALIEERGRLALPLEDGSVFTLSAQADRIEVAPDGTLTVVDYKTGKAPTLKEIKAGFAPQITLEAAMAEGGAFPALAAGAIVASAFFVKVHPRGAAEPTVWHNVSLGDVVREHRDGLLTLLNLFRDPGTGYLARPYPQFAKAFNPYDHLARVKEWSAGELDEEEGA